MKKSININKSNDKKFVTSIHNSTKRNYLNRMNNQKVKMYERSKKIFKKLLGWK